jgi:HlyD family secretion protein
MNEPYLRRTSDGQDANGGVAVATLRERVRELRLPDRETNPAGGGRSQSNWLPWLLCLLLAGSTFSLAVRVYTRPAAVNDPFSLATKADSAPTKSKSDEDKPRPVTTQASSGDVVLQAKGYLLPAHQITVSPIEVSGQIIELNVLEGRRFEKGDVLARLDPVPFQADVDDARYGLSAAEERFAELETGFRKQEIAQARHELSEAEALLKRARLEYERNSRLTSGAVPTREFEQSETEFRAADQRVRRLTLALELMNEGPRKERIAAAQAEVRQSKARVARAEWRLNNTIIRAPVSGTILTKKVELGTLVNPLAFSASFGSGICDMADLSDMECELDIQERDIAKVFVGMSCRLRADAYPDRVYQARVDRLMPQADRAKGSVAVRVKVIISPEEEGVYLKPNMAAVVSFLNAPAGKEKANGQ